MMMFDLNKAVWIGLLVVGLGTAGPQPVATAQEQESTRRELIKKVTPIYPIVARKAGLSGVVKLELVVTPEGTVKSLRTVGGNPVLALAAEEATKRWRFKVSATESVELVAITFEPPK